MNQNNKPPTPKPAVLGALLPAEREVIRERDELVRRFHESTDPAEREQLLRRIETVVGRYEQMRRGRWEREEIK